MFAPDLLHISVNVTEGASSRDIITFHSKGAFWSQLNIVMNYNH